MGFFDFLKGRKEEPKENERVAFGDLDFWIGNKSLEVEKEREVFLGLIKDRTSKLIEELRQGMEGLENLKWDKIRAEERIKLIVKENLGNYVLHLGQLADELESLEHTDKVRDKIDSVFSAFDKRTGMNYQKATILIGKELERIRVSASTFFKDLDKIQKNNKNLVENIGVISNVKEKLKEFEESEKRILEINREMKSIKEEIGKLNGKIDDNEREIEKVRKSEKYLEWKEKRDKLDEGKENLNSGIKELRGAIDFKALARTWHENKPEMNVLKRYRENFQEAFQKDKGEVLGKLIDSLDNKDSLRKSLSRVIELDKEIGSVKLGVSLTHELEERIGKIRNEILSLEARETEGKKRAEKIETGKASVFGDIRKEVGKIGGDVEK